MDSSVNLCKERRHISVEPAVHDDSEMASDRPELVESLNTVIATVVQGHVVDLKMLILSLGVHVCVLVRQDLLVLAVPADLRPGVADNPACEGDRLPRLDSSISRSVHHERCQRSLHHPLPFSELRVRLEHPLVLDSLDLN